MDELIFEEFKGTGNMELHLDRALQEKRIYPAIHPVLSATRREELLYHPDEWDRVLMLRKTMSALPPLESMEKLVDNLHATKTNAELLLSGMTNVIASDATLFKLLKKIDIADRVAVDTEADSLHSYREKLCLIQISVPVVAGIADAGREQDEFEMSHDHRSRLQQDFIVDP